MNYMTKTFSEQLPINVITNILVFILSVVINLFLTPFYIDTVGIEGLGLLRLALSIPMYTSLVTIFISGAVSRYLVIALQQADMKQANAVFNTAFVSLAVLLIVFFPILFILFFNIDAFLNIPSQFSNNVSWLFMAVLFTSMISLISTVFMIPAQAYNRLEIVNITKVIVTVVQTALIIILLSFFPKIISMVGLAFAIGSLLSLLLAIKVWRKFSPELIIHFSLFDKEIFKKISGTGSWLIVGHLGTLLFLYVDLLIVNLFFGAESTGEYSIGLQWSTLIRTLAGVFAGVIAPMILISYAQKNISKLIDISRMGVKFIGLILALSIGLIVGFSEPLLLLWIGQEYVELAPLLWLMLIPLVINLSVMPLFSLTTAHNQVKIPAIITVIMGILNVALAIGISFWFDFGIYGVALASAIILTLKNSLFIPIYSAKVANVKTFTFVKAMLPGLLFVIIVSGLSLLINSYFSIVSWSSLVTSGLVIVFFVSGLMWFFALSHKERSYLIDVVKTKMAKENSSTERGM